MKPRRRQSATIASMLFACIGFACAIMSVRFAGRPSRGCDSTHLISTGGGSGVGVGSGVPVVNGVGTTVGVNRVCNAMSKVPWLKLAQVRPAT